MIEFGLGLLLWAVSSWIIVVSILRVSKFYRSTKYDGMCGCGHNISFHMAPKGSKCHYMRPSYSTGCGCQRFVSKMNPTSAMIEAGERGLQ